ncbi:MAG: histidine ammonia-lyase [Planctomycetia bacterium]|nr:MAG: histidine ammonia-lyase [Planctomycetia bacterium]
MDAVPLTLEEGAELSLTWLDGALDRPLAVRLSPGVRARIARAAGWVAKLAGGGAAVYGVNTGFGHLKNRRIAADQLELLQENLLISHAVGVGPAAPAALVRLMLLFKLRMLGVGHSGVRPEVAERIVAWLNADALPVVPTRGSLGASGDLAPLSHLFLPLLGRGVMSVPANAAAGDSNPAGRREVTSDEAGRRFGWSAMALAAKEGLALINGTQFTCAYAAGIAVRAARLADLADLILTMSIEGLRGSIRPADERLHAVRPHAGAQRVAATIRGHLEGSEILASHADCDRVQDPYSLRCAPQVHGAFRDALDHFRATVTREMNSVTDNPLLFERADGTVEAVSGGNFHAEPLALVLDYMAIALTDLANISERRCYLLLGGEDGLPKLLMRDTGVNSGFMIAQYTAAALLNECKVLATPASVDSIPTSLGQEDHVSMGATAALKCHEVLDRVEHVLGIEMLLAAQALDFRAPLRAGKGPRRAHEVIRGVISHAERDREFGLDIRAAVTMLRESAALRKCAAADLR